VSALQVADLFENMTGDSASETLGNYLSDAANRTDQRLPSIVYTRLRIGSAYAMWPEYSDVTDANALQRTIHENFVGMSERLVQLSNAARTIFPGMRALTEPESANLRGYYKKVFRKA